MAACTSAFTDRWDDLRCDLRAGHEGAHEDVQTHAPSIVAWPESASDERNPERRAALAPHWCSNCMRATCTMHHDDPSWPCPACESRPAAVTRG